jgi:hypothetical protein
MPLKAPVMEYLICVLHLVVKTGNNFWGMNNSILKMESAGTSKKSIPLFVWVVLYGVAAT